MTRWLIDTNVLLRMCDKSSPDHARCIDAVARRISRADACHSCAQTLIEFWVVATRPRKVNGLGLSNAEALANLVDFQTLLPCLLEPPNVRARWQDLVTRYDVKGKNAHDARIAALMIEHQIQDILTLNPRDFSRYSEINTTEVELANP